MPLQQCQRCSGQIYAGVCLHCGYSPEPPGPPEPLVVDGRYAHLSPGPGNRTPRRKAQSKEN